MKKVFVEPDMRKIELNLSENIAESVQENNGYYFLVGLFSCTIQSTGKSVFQVTEAEAEVCRVNARAKIGGGTLVSPSEARMHFKN